MRAGWPSGFSTASSRRPGRSILGSGENRLKRFAVIDPELRSFAPGEVKRHVVDFPIVDDGFGVGVAPGRYTFRGGFGRNYADIPVVLLPF